MTTHNWSPQQSRALTEVSRWLKEKDRQIFTLFGYAGTGKTTLARHLAEQSDGHVLFAAYTGKAASVLRRAGCVNASTLHSLLYSVTNKDQSQLEALELDLAAMRAQPEPDEWAIRELEVKVHDLRKELAQPHFTLQEQSEIQDADLIVVDECSMIDKRLGEDLESFGKPILVMGDPFQLPPVRKGAGKYDTDTPDIMLTEVHRQAAESAILRWATQVRETGRDLPFKIEGNAAKLSKREVDPYALLDLTRGQIITGKNATRTTINTRFRRKLGHDAPYPVKGDRLVALRNHKDFGMLNGVVCEAAADSTGWEGDEPAISCDILYEGRLISQVPVERHYFDRYQDTTLPDDPLGSWFDRQWMMPMDFGYALTVHKSQGSQWDQVLVADDGMLSWQPSMRMRWLYTAITRAKEELIIVA